MRNPVPLISVALPKALWLGRLIMSREIRSFLSLSIQILLEEIFKKEQERSTLAEIGTISLVLGAADASRSPCNEPAIRTHRKLIISKCPRGCPIVALIRDHDVG